MRASDSRVRAFLDAHQPGWETTQTNCPSLAITSVTLQHPDFPTQNWVSLPNNKTIDGNPVRITMRVQNNGTSFVTRQVRITETESGNVLVQKDIEFPPGSTDTQVMTWDTSGYAWSAGQRPKKDRQLRMELVGISNQVDNTYYQPVKVIPKPLILVHGIASNADSWNSYLGFALNLYPEWIVHRVSTMNTGGSLFGAPNPFSPSNSIPANVLALDTEIDSVQRTYDAWQVDVVAYSLGGLITRYYIDQGMPSYSVTGTRRPQISHFLMLATPNAGSCDADFLMTASPLLALLSPNQSLWALRTDSVQNFNRTITNSRGVPFSILYGEAGWMGSLGAFCDLLEPGDGVVTVRSATALGIPAAPIALLHTEFQGSQTAFSTFVLPQLAVPPAAAAPAPLLPVTNNSIYAAPATPATDTIHANGGVQLQAPAQGTGQTSIEIAGGTRADVWLIAPPDGSSRLYDPANRLAVEVVGGSTQAASAWRKMTVNNPQPGTWRLQVENPGTTALTLPVLIMIENDPLVLDFTITTTTQVNRYQITASLKNTGVIVTDAQVVTVNFVQDGNSQAQFTLYDDGLHQDGSANDGIYGNASTTVMPGFYSVLVRSTKGSLVRVASQGYTALPSPVLISPANNALSTNRQPVFTWGSVPTAVRYEMRLSTDNPPTNSVYDGPGLSYQPPAPLSFATYYWQVRAINQGGVASEWSILRSVTVSSPLDAAPARNYYTTLPINLTWARVSWATEYEVQIDELSTFISPIGGIVPGSQLSYPITNISDGIYYWRVRARTPDGTWGAWSVVDSFTIDVP